MDYGEQRQPHIYSRTTYNTLQSCYLYSCRLLPIRARVLCLVCSGKDPHKFVFALTRCSPGRKSYHLIFLTPLSKTFTALTHKRPSCSPRLQSPRNNWMKPICTQSHLNLQFILDFTEGRSNLPLNVSYIFAVWVNAARCRRLKWMPGGFVECDCEC